MVVADGGGGGGGRGHGGGRGARFGAKQSSGDVTSDGDGEGLQANPVAMSTNKLAHTFTITTSALPEAEQPDFASKSNLFAIEVQVAEPDFATLPNLLAQRRLENRTGKEKVEQSYRGDGSLMQCWNQIS